MENFKLLEESFVYDRKGPPALLPEPVLLDGAKVL